MERDGEAVDDEMGAQLIKEFLEDEVRKLIKNYDGNKSPSPDGFTAQSIKKGRLFMKNNILWISSGSFTKTVN